MSYVFFVYWTSSNSSKSCSLSASRLASNFGCRLLTCLAVSLSFTQSLHMHREVTGRARRESVTNSPEEAKQETKEGIDAKFQSDIGAKTKQPYLLFFSSHLFHWRQRNERNVRREKGQLLKERMRKLKRSRNWYLKRRVMEEDVEWHWQTSDSLHLQSSTR